MLDIEKFPPPDDFRKQALVTDDSMYEEAAADLQGFWAKQADELIDWFDGADRRSSTTRTRPSTSGSRTAR